jgi:hypothetical protein
MARLNTKWDRRDKKRHKKKHGMRISGRSILTIVNAQRKRAKEVKHDDLTEE